ncbi:MAG: AMP-binding protein [Gemmatimonadaceae bacterium]
MLESRHADRFCEEQLPPAELHPVMLLEGIGEYAARARINCVAELLDSAIARGDGARPAIRFPGGMWTYTELFERTNRIARVLVEDYGIVPGNRVLLRGANTPMFAACWLAIVKAGAVAVATMPLLREREIQYVAEKAAVSLAITDTSVAEDCRRAVHVPVVEYGGADAELETRMEGKKAIFNARDTAATEIALIAFTSGSTGQGKGTMHSHRDVMAITECFPRHVLRATRDDLFCGSPPLAFTYALGGLLLFPLRAGACTLLLEQASPPNLAKAIAEYRPTICFTAPTAYRAMHALLGEHDVSSLRRCVSAGETLPLSVFEAWRDATGVKIIDGIGATEMLHIFISSSDDDIRPGSTGRAVPGYEARIVDDDMQAVPDGEAGRLAVRGPTGCRYLGNLDQQRTYVRDGWNLTGDSYVRDADGYFWYQARTDDIIVSSGYNIAGPEVENVLLEHEAVQECAVVGAPDAERGQVVKAFVVLRAGHSESEMLLKELQDFVKARIAPYKYPRAVAVVPALPRTTTGKVQRFRLREEES